jgi:glucose/arabinose dehydrogenase
VPSRTALVAVLLATWLLSGCGGARQPGGQPGEAAGGANDAAPRLPLWRQAPDKPPGPSPARAAGRARSFTLRLLATGLRKPVQVVARPGDRRLYVAEQRGTVRVLERGVPRRRAFLDLRRRVLAGGERGLLTIAFAPDGRHLYAMYTDRRGDTRVVAARAGRDAADPGGTRTLLAVDQPYENHKGGTLLVDGRGRLLLGLGDGGSAFDPDHRAQDPASKLGKLLRYDPARPQAGWRTLAIGLRNPWRLSRDRRTGLVWIGDVGQDELEEVDAVRLPEAGGGLLNLGWPAFEAHRPVGRKPLRRLGRLVWPVAAYRHREGCSVTGGHVYRGRSVRALRGRYVYGDLCTGTMWSLDARGAADRAAADLRREAAHLPGLVSFGEDASGELLAVSVRGRIMRLAPRRARGV